LSRNSSDSLRRRAGLSNRRDQEPWHPLRRTPKTSVSSAISSAIAPAQSENNGKRTKPAAKRVRR
jgi:hypothetical protein